MRVLQQAPRVCWPLNTGAKLRNYHLARVLSERADTTLVAFVDDEQPVTELQDVYQEVITVRRPPGYTLPKILRGLWGRTPLPVLNYTTNAMKVALEGLLSKRDFDLIQVESIHMMAYLPAMRAARRRPLVICDWHNIESQLMRRYAERETNLLRRSYARKTARLMRDFERRALNEFDAHLAVSQKDADQLRSLNSGAKIFVIENGVNTADYSNEQIEQAYAARPSADIDRSVTKRIIFVGSMDYHANIDGAVSFARDVWPPLRAANPDLVFTLVGRDPAPEVRELKEISGVEVTGTVPDVRPFYREAVVAIVPLKVGGGSRLKILEAMAAGVPVVSTTLGAEGLDVRHGENILIADTNEQLVEAISAVVGNEEQRKRLCAAGHALVSRRYDWSTLGNKLLEIYQKLLASQSPPSGSEPVG